MGFNFCKYSNYKNQKIRSIFKILIYPLVLLFSFNIYANIKETSFSNPSIIRDSAEFENLFRAWTDAFNRKDLKASCALFSEKLSADYQGYPSKNYHSICQGFKKIFNEDNKNYHYDFKIQHSYRSNDLAAVRITWYLTLTDGQGQKSFIQDEGIDILERVSNQWKIINFLGYQARF